MITGKAYADFLPATDDIPLMDGVVLTETEDFAFDTPAGQILTFDATTKKTTQEVRAFYQETLTAMGWHARGKDSYARGGDTLVISFPKAGQIHFDITLSSHNDAF